MIQHLVSVIVPVYKAEKYLHKCVDSLLAQTFTDFEVILVDDGSPDRSGAICDDYAAKDSRVRVIHKENGGVSSARNMGLDQVRGEWVAFVDSDDWVDPDFLECFRNLSHDVEMIHCGLQLEVKPGKFIRCSVFSQHRITPNELLTPLYFSSCSVSFFYKYSLIQDADLRFCSNIKYSEDRQFIIKYLSYCSGDILLVNNQGYHYCLNYGSAVHSKRNYERCLDDLHVLYSLRNIPFVVANRFVFCLFVKSFILAFSAFCDKNRPDLNVVVNDLMHYTEGFPHRYWLFQLFVKYPLLTTLTFRFYWKARSMYYKMK